MSNVWSVGKRNKYADTRSGELVVMAGGACVWDDLSKVPGFIQDKWEQSFEVMAVNDVGMHIPYKLSHWYSNDSWIQYWSRARRPRFSRGGMLFRSHQDETILLHSYTQIPGCIEWGWPGGGTSSLNACMTGLGLGYDRIYLCGAPLDDGPHYFDPPWVKTNFSRSGGLREWQNHRDRFFEGKVISMSGNTKRILDGEDLV